MMNPLWWWAPISIITSISISLTAPANRACWYRGLWWGRGSPSVTNTDHCTLGWAIIWTCIKTIYKQCNWPGSEGDARQRKGKERGMDRLTNFCSVPTERFINFCGCNWIFERFLLKSSSMARAALTSHRSLPHRLVVSQNAQKAVGREDADRVQ